MQWNRNNLNNLENITDFTDEIRSRLGKRPSNETNRKNSYVSINNEVHNLDSVAYKLKLDEDNVMLKDRDDNGLHLSQHINDVSTDEKTNCNLKSDVSIEAS